MKEKLKTTSFWLGIGSCVILIISCLSKIFGFEICEEQIENVVVTICSVLVTMGIITKKNTTDADTNSKDELIADIESFKTDNDKEI